MKSLYSQLKSLLVPSAIMYADIPGLRFYDSPQATINTILNNRHSFKTRLIVIVSDANKTIQVS